MVLVDKHTFFSFFMNLKGDKPKRRRMRKKSNCSSKVLKYIVYSLMNGLHSNVLYWKGKGGKKEGIFKVKFVHKSNPKWNENMLSLFKATEEAISKERSRNYSMSSKHAEKCKTRFRANLNKLISTGALFKVPCQDGKKLIDKSVKTFKIANFSSEATPSTSSSEDELIPSPSASTGHENFISDLLKDPQVEEIGEIFCEMNATREEKVKVESQVLPPRSADTSSNYYAFPQENVLPPISADTSSNYYAFPQENVSFTVNSLGMSKLGKVISLFREYSVVKSMNVQWQTTNSSPSAQAAESANKFSSSAQVLESANKFCNSSSQAVEFSANDMLSNLLNEVGNQLIVNKFSIGILEQVLDILREGNATEWCPGGLSCQSKEQPMDIENCTFIAAPDSIQMQTYSEETGEPTLNELNGMDFSGLMNDPHEFNKMVCANLHSPRENKCTELQNVVPNYDDYSSLAMDDGEEGYYSSPCDDNRKITDFPTFLKSSENPFLSSTVDLYNGKADEYTDMEGLKFFGI